MNTIPPHPGNGNGNGHNKPGLQNPNAASGNRPQVDASKVAVSMAAQMKGNVQPPRASEAPSAPKIREPLEDFTVAPLERQAMNLELELLEVQLEKTKKAFENARNMLRMSKDNKLLQKAQRLEKDVMMITKQVALWKDDIRVTGAALLPEEEKDFADLKQTYTDGSKVRLIQLADRRGWSADVLSDAKVLQAVNLLLSKTGDGELIAIPLKILRLEREAGTVESPKQPPLKRTEEPMDTDTALFTALMAMTYRVDQGMQRWNENVTPRELLTYHLKEEKLSEVINGFGGDSRRDMNRFFYMTEKGAMPKILRKYAEGLRKRCMDAEQAREKGRQASMPQAVAPSEVEKKRSQQVEQLAEELNKLLTAMPKEQKEAVVETLPNQELQSMAKQVATMRPSGKEAVKPFIDTFKNRYCDLLSQRLGDKGVMLGINSFQVMLKTMEMMGQMDKVGPEMKEKFFSLMRDAGVDAQELEKWLGKWGITNPSQGKVHRSQGTSVTVTRGPTVAEMSEAEQRKKDAADKARAESERAAARRKLMEKLTRRPKEAVSKEEQLVLDSLGRSIKTSIDPENGAMKKNLFDEIVEFGVKTGDWEKIPQDLQKTFYNTFAVGAQFSLKILKKQLQVEGGIPPVLEPGEVEEQVKEIPGLDRENFKAVLADVELTINKMAALVRDSFYKKSAADVLEMLVRQEKEQQKKDLLNSNNLNVQHVKAYAQNNRAQL